MELMLRQDAPSTIAYITCSNFHMGSENRYQMFTDWKTLNMTNITKTVHVKSFMKLICMVILS